MVGVGDGGGGVKPLIILSTILIIFVIPLKKNRDISVKKMKLNSSMSLNSDKLQIKPNNAFSLIYNKRLFLILEQTISLLKLYKIILEHLLNTTTQSSWLRE